MQLPLFPLNAVLFPGGPLRLRIFEPRYLDMIGRCMREDSPFGVAMIVEGAEVGPARTATIGTTATVHDFEQLSGGLLGIKARGSARFRIETVTRQDDGLSVADVNVLANDLHIPVPAAYEPLVHLMRGIYPQVAILYGDAPGEFEDASWLSARLAELLPLPLHQRQHCLELDNPIERLRFVFKLVCTGADVSE
jgi:Lon protease-like protein